MRIKKNQKGLTGISILVIIMLFAFTIVTLLKILPIYFDSYKVADVVSTLEDERGLGDRTNNDIAALILKRLEVNQVSGIVKNDIYVEKTKNKVIVDVEYEVRKAMFGNLDIIISFKHSVEASAI